jgi:hypothetical protein
MLVKYSQGKGLKDQRPTKKMVIETFIQMGVRHNIFESNWVEKLLKENERIKEHAEAGSRCSALAVSVNDEKKKDYRCVWFREDKPPQIRKLGNTKRMKDAACLACGKTGEVVAKLKARDNKIIELETGLQNRARELYKIPVCEGGAHLSVEGTSFERCRRSNISVDVLRFCKVVDDGPCAYFREKVIGVGEKR